MNEKRLKEIEARKAEIRAALEDTSKDIDLDATNAELDALNAEETNLKKRAAMARSLETGKVDPDKVEKVPGADEDEEDEGGNTMNEEKKKALDAVLAQIEKSYGKGAIMKLGANAGNVDIEVIPTGCLALDLALGIGGLPRGRMVEIYGPESSGKTTVALHAVASAQKMGGIAAFVDAEHALDPTYAKALGVDLDELYVSQPDTGEQALDIVDSLVRSSAVDIIVVDSVAALTPKAEIEGDMGDSHVGLQARLMSQALRKLTAIVNKSKTCVVFINQLREKVGVMFGNPEVTPGGKALKFYASIRIDVRKTDILKDSDGAAGNRTRAKVVKNKLAPPFRQAEFDIMYGEGVSQEGCVIDLGIQYDVIQKSGAWFSYQGNKVANGKEKMRQFLKDNPELMREMEDKIRQMAKGMPAEGVAGEVSGEEDK